MSFDRAIRNWNHKRIDRMRRLKLSLTNGLFSHFSKFVPLELEQSILVLRLDGKLGDSVAATGFLRELKKHNPESRLVVVAAVAGALVYKDLTFVDEVIVAKKGFFTTLDLYFKLKKNQYKFIINTSHILNPRVLFLTSLLPAFKKVTMANPMYKLFSDHVDIDFKKDHITDRYRKTLELLGLKKSDMSYQIHTDQKTDQKAQVCISEIRKQAGRVIALNSFAGASLRNFNQQVTVQIVQKLLLYPGVVVISLANEGDHRILNRWIDSSFDGRWVHLPEFSSLEMNIALLKNSDLVITPDTAWVHIASALKKKLVAVYREDRNPEELNSVAWAPYETENKIIFAHSDQNNPDDINNVNIDEIVQAVVQMLGLSK